MEKVDKRFALIARDGDVLFPYKKAQVATKRFGFALSKPGDLDRHGGGHYTDDLADVIQRVVFDGWRVRATTIDKAGRQRHGSLGLGKTAIGDYWVAPEFRGLVANAPIPPIDTLPSR
jgi:hypothetical protein